MISEIKRTTKHNNYSCFYCEPYDGLAGKIPHEKRINLGILGDFKIEIYIKKRRSLASLFMQIHGEKSRDQIGIELGDISYCPWCGKKLIKEEK